MVLDAQAKKLNRHFCQGPGAYQWMHATIEDIHVVFLKPLTYMNRSGIAVSDAITRLQISMNRCLVVLDDLALPLGQLRLRARGSDGGHRGLASVLNYCHSQNIPRLRMGIGGAEDQETIHYVLSPFSRKNKPIVKKMVERAVQAIFDFVIQGIHPAMNAVNTSI
jgi:PTH1 family peptidyl-tRNA hydrolase